MLALLRHPRQLTTNPIAQAEWTYLQNTSKHQNPCWWMLNGLLLLLTLSGAIVPFVTYINAYNGNLYLALLILVSVLLVWTETKTVLTTLHTIQRHQQSKLWDSLVLSGIDARCVVIGEWWVIVRCQWRSYVRLSLFRFALAYAAAQVLNLYPLDLGPALTGFNQWLYYFSIGSGAAWNPSINKAIVAGIVILIYGLAQAGLITALGLAATFITRRLNFAALPVALILRGIIVILAAVALATLAYARPEISRLLWYAQNNTPYNWVFVYTSGCDEPPNSSNDYCRWFPQEHNNRMVVEAAQTSFSTLADSGILLAAQIMRPAGSRPFVLRSIASAVAGLLLYGLAMAILLWFAQVFAVMRHNLLPPE